MEICIGSVRSWYKVGLSVWIMNICYMSKKRLSSGFGHGFGSGFGSYCGLSLKFIVRSLVG